MNQSVRDSNELATIMAASIGEAKYLAGLLGKAGKVKKQTAFFDISSIF